MHLTFELAVSWSKYQDQDLEQGTNSPIYGTQIGTIFLTVPLPELEKDHAHCSVPEMVLGCSMNIIVEIVANLIRYY